MRAAKKVVSRHSRRIEFLFASARARQTKLSYFFGSIDFARCDAEIDDLATIDRSPEVTQQPATPPMHKESIFVGSQQKSEKSPMTHKLNSPHEWLLDKAQHWNTDALYKALSDLAYQLDGQSIRDLFHSEMKTDGYFENITKSRADAFDAESWGSHRWHT